VRRPAKEKSVLDQLDPHVRLIRGRLPNNRGSGRLRGEEAAEASDEEARKQR